MLNLKLDTQSLNLCKKINKQNSLRCLMTYLGAVTIVRATGLALLLLAEHWSRLLLRCLFLSLRCSYFSSNLLALLDRTL